MTSVALLAPVPEEHLLSGQAVCLSKGLVAFGSKNWDLFSKLKNVLPESSGCEALIYASDAARPLSPPRVTWSAKYISFSVAINGAHKYGMKFRPESTQKYPADNHGHWVVFWEVTDLIPLIPDIKIGLLRGFEKPHPYLKNFIPKGPLLIQAV